MKTQFVSGPVKAFETQLNGLLAESQLALAVSSVTFAAGQLAAVVTETQVSPSVSGSAIRVKVLTGKAAKLNETVAALRQENPCWHPLAVFPVAAPAKGSSQDSGDEPATKAGHLVAVLQLVQP